MLLLLDNRNQSHQGERLRQPFEADDHLIQMKRKIGELQKEFCSHLEQSYTSLKSKVSIDRLQVYITQRCVDRRQSIPLFDRGMIEIISQSTHEQVFMLMSRIGAWNFLDYSLLRDIMNNFDISGAELASYSLKVTEFQKNTKLVDYLHVSKMNCLPEEPFCNTLIAKCTGINYEEITIDEVCERAKLLAGEFNLHTLCASIGGAASGCLYLLWYIPESVAKHLERTMESKDRPNLVSHGFQQLIIGKKIYEVRYNQSAQYNMNSTMIVVTCVLWYHNLIQDCGQLQTFSDLHQLSVMDPEYFFGKVGESLLDWKKPFKRAYRCCTSKRMIEWFSEGKLNVSGRSCSAPM